MVSYKDTEEALKELLIQFTPDREKIRTEYPFGRLRHDGLWEIHGTRGPIAEGPGGDLLVSSLRQQDAYGGFPLEIYSKLQNDRRLAIEIAHSLVDNHFTDQLRDMIMDTVEIKSEFEIVRRRTRNSKFSSMVRNAYEHRCAVCGFSMCMNGNHLAMEGAHIHWHCRQGPDQIPNGLALCVLHHELFDVGAFTVSYDRKVIVATSVDGPGFDDSLGRFRYRKIFLPKTKDNYPAHTYLKWHHEKRFKSYEELYGELTGQ